MSHTGRGSTIRSRYQLEDAHVLGQHQARQAASLLDREPGEFRVLVVGHPLRPRRLAEAVALIGGPAGNVASFALLAGASAAGWLSPQVAQQLAFPQLLVAALSPVPFSVQQGGRRLGSDGAQLLRLLRTRMQPLAESLVTMMRHWVPDAGAADLSRATPVIGRLVVQLSTEQEDWARQEAAASLAEHLDGVLTNAERVVVLSVLAEAEMAQGGIGAEWDDPERWTRELVQISITPVSRILRGAALIRSGSPVEGRALLEPLSAQEADPASAIKSCLYTACVSRSCGDQAAAEVACNRAGDLAERHDIAFDKEAFEAAVAAAPSRLRRITAQRPGNEVTGAGMIAAILVASCLSAAVVGAVASRAGERRGYLAACDERVAARSVSTTKPSGVECGR